MAEDLEAEADSVAVAASRQEEDWDAVGSTEVVSMEAAASVEAVMEEDLVANILVVRVYRFWILLCF